MEKLADVDSRGLQRPIGSGPRLPPRIPSVPGRGLPPSDVGTGIHTSQSCESQKQHKRTPSCNVVMQEPPLWLDDLLEDSECSSSKKSSHRRSASDSFTCLENARGFCSFGNIAEVDELEYNSSVVPEKLRDRNTINTSTLTDLLEEIQQLQDRRNAPISALTQPAAARCDVSKADEMRTLAGQTVFVPEANSKDSDTCSYDSTAGDANADLKKTKRQSAQRSRVRKLQYIAELEKIVNVLQTQVSSLSPQLLFFRHQRALLSMDNSSLKQKIALCMHEKTIKDSQNETLGKEIQRLQALRELQAFHELRKQQQHRIHRHSSLPSDFEAQLQQYSKSNVDSQQLEPDTSSSDVLPRVMKEFADISLDSHLDSSAQQDS